MVAFIRYKIIALLLAAITAVSLQPADSIRFRGETREETVDTWTLTAEPEWSAYWRALSSEEASVPLSVAVAQISRNFSDRLSLLQEEDQQPFELEGETADWVEVLAVYTALFYNGRRSLAIDSLRRLTPEQCYLLELVYFNMNDVRTEQPEPEETEKEENQTGETTTEMPPLKVTMKGRTAEELIRRYPLNEQQTLLMEKVFDNSDEIRRMLTDYNSLTKEAAEVLAALPEDLPAERRSVVEAACSMVRKISFFWGGKSLLYGWDARWGTLQKVEEEGSRTTGSYRPYGLDCSGFVDRAFFNASGIYFGGGTKVQYSTCTRVEMDKAQPGDLVFRYDENGDISHIGIVCGRDAEGGLRVVHCNSQDETVVITGADAFQLAGRPSCYLEEYRTEEENVEPEEMNEAQDEVFIININETED